MGTRQRLAVSVRSCGICAEELPAADFSAGATVKSLDGDVLQLSCKHLFHSSCIRGTLAAIRTSRESCLPCSAQCMGGDVRRYCCAYSVCIVLMVLTAISECQGSAEGCDVSCVLRHVDSCNRVCVGSWVQAGRLWARRTRARCAWRRWTCAAFSPAAPGRRGT